MRHKNRKIDPKCCQLVMTSLAVPNDEIHCEVTHLPTGKKGNATATGYLRARIMALHDLEEKLK